MHKDPPGKVEISISRDNVKKIMNRLKGAGIEAYETGDGVGMHMSKEDAETVAAVLAEFGITKESVENHRNPAIDREPAEKLIEIMRNAQESLRESLGEIRRLK